MTHGAFRRDDPESSVIAALSVDASRLQKVVIEQLAKHGPGTAEEIADWGNETLQSITPRMVPLEELGVVYRTGEVRRGKCGRDRIVWALVTQEPRQGRLL